MVAAAQYADSVRTALRAGADAIVCGAGLPRDLPALAAEVSESDAAIVPVVSAAVLRSDLQAMGPSLSAGSGFRDSGGSLPAVIWGSVRGRKRSPGRTSETAVKPPCGSSGSLEALPGKIWPGYSCFVAGGVKNGHEMRQYMEQARREHSSPPVLSPQRSVTPVLVSNRLFWTRSRRTLPSCRALWNAGPGHTKPAD